jgi:hypothetical protein
MKKKAQTEIMGLLTIVVLFIFIGLIYIMLAGKADKGSLTQDIVQYEKVQNLLSSFIQITPCYTKVPYDQMSTIIKDCYASDGSATICGKPCKDFITAEMDSMMKAYNPKQAYEFKILKGKEEFISKKKCPSTAGTGDDCCSCPCCCCDKLKETCPTNIETRAGSIDLSRDLTLRLTYCIK